MRSSHAVSSQATYVTGCAGRRTRWYKRHAGKLWQGGEREPFTADLLPKQPRAELPRLAPLPPKATTIPSQQITHSHTSATPVLYSSHQQLDQQAGETA